MIGPLKKLFDVQHERLASDARFARRLHPGRTVFLSELLQDVRDPSRAALLDAPWLDVGRLVSRIAAACVFLDGVAAAKDVPGWRGMPLVFLQSGDVDEDARQHLKRLSLGHGNQYPMRHAHLPPAVHYLHTHSQFCHVMRGSWKRSTLTIEPHFYLATGEESLVYDGSRRPFRTKSRVLGYRLTDLPGILDVSPMIATDYFARGVVHDLCHYFLPPTPFAAEGFHNAAALAAMGELPAIPYRNAWEKFVHDECLDPTFCLRAGREIAAVRRSLGVASLVQEDFLQALSKWYDHPDAVRRRLERWGLPPGLPESDQAGILRDLIRRAQGNGFRIYIRLLRKA